MKRIAIALVTVLCLVVVGVAYADDDVPPDVCDTSAAQPVAERLAERYEVTSDAILEWFCKGYGMGEIRLALILGKDGPDWQDLLNAKVDGVGWGEIRIALWVARATGEDWDVILRQRQEGLGWGEIRRGAGLIGRSPTGEGDEGPDPDREPGPPDYAGPKWRGGDDRPGPPPHAGPKP